MATKLEKTIPVSVPTPLGLPHTPGPHLIVIKVGMVGNTWRIIYEVDGVLSQTCKAKRNEKIEWECDKTWAVDFSTKTPFDQAQIFGDAGKRHGGPVRANAPGGRYKYFVAVLINDNGQLRILTDDPEVDVEEG